MRILLTIIALLITPLYSFGAPMKTQNESLIIGGGCFWCMEAIFQRLKGVESVVSGYTGGKRENPSYEEVSSGDSGHAEVVKVTFDPATISRADLLYVFFHLHDPTTFHRQGADVGSQYRSVVYYASESEKKIIEETMAKITAAKLWPDPLVTEVSPLGPFYSAEQYHQNYFNNNGKQPYCAVVIAPKINKLLKEFKDKVKESK